MPSLPASPVLSDGAAVYTAGLSERRGGASKFVGADALGSTRVLTDGSQSATDSLLFDAFGMTVSRSGGTPTPFGFAGRAGYQGDADTGLLLLGHRYYDPGIGRFLSADPAQAGDNWYAYCGNDPVSETDPSGYQTSLENPANAAEAVEAAMDTDAGGGGSYPPGYDPNAPPKFPIEGPIRPSVPRPGPPAGPPAGPPTPPQGPPPAAPPDGPGLIGTIKTTVKWIVGGAVLGPIGNGTDRWVIGGGPGRVLQTIKRFFTPNPDDPYPVD